LGDLHIVTVRIRHLATLALALVAAAGLLWSSPAHAADTCDVAGIKVLVKDQSGPKKVPVEGVVAIVKDEAGAEVGRGTTDAKGGALICVPTKTTYTVEIDQSSLKDGMALDGEAVATVNEDSFTTSTKTMSFFTGVAERSGDGYWNLLVKAIVNGIRLGMVIAICSVGLSLIFGTTGLTNFAHGELVTFGGLTAHLLSVTWGVPFLLSAVLTIFLGGLFGLGLNRGVWGPLRKKGIGLISQMVVSVGLAIILVNLYLMRFGGTTKRYQAYNDQVAMEWGPIQITARDLTTTIISLIVLVALALVLQKSRLGKATRAVSDNADLASSTGIDSEKIIRIVWFLGGSLAALGGIIRGLDEGVKADMGGQLLFLMFAGITLGGLGSAYGALVGGFLVGLFVEVSTMGIPAFPSIPFLTWIKDGVPTELKTVPALAALILILLLRPQGILGRKERVG
jgi:branched-chain amino acid transport system permease protein